MRRLLLAIALWAAPLPAVEYSGGTYTNQTLTQASGTRAELAAWIIAQLQAAGWSVSSGSGNDVVLSTATTPQGYSAKVRVWDPGSGSCVRLGPRNASESRISATNQHLLPAVGKAWRIVANKYQYFVFGQGAAAAREYAAFGVPYVPAFLTSGITEVAWGIAAGETDSDTNGRCTWRNGLGARLGASSCIKANQLVIFNGTLYEGSNSNSAADGDLRLLAPYPTLYGSTNTAVLFSDNSFLISDAYVMFGLSSHTDQARIVGQLWDAVILGETFSAEQTFTYDGKTFLVHTLSNNGQLNSGTFSQRGTLALVVP